MRKNKFDDYIKKSCKKRLNYDDIKTNIKFDELKHNKSSSIKKKWILPFSISFAGCGVLALIISLTLNAVFMNFDYTNSDENQSPISSSETIPTDSRQELFDSSDLVYTIKTIARLDLITYEDVVYTKYEIDILVKIKGSEDIKFIYLLGDSINNVDDIDNLEIMELNDCYKIYLIKNEFGYITTVPYESIFDISTNA